MECTSTGRTPDPTFALVPRQLPGDVHGFVNRLGEMEVLSNHLRDEGPEGGARSPIHVITGTAGVGKTALALHWAHRVREHFPDGQLYVDLRGYGAGSSIEPDQVLNRFLRALDVPADAVPPDIDSRSALFRSLLAERCVLILLDNAATAAQVRPLLPAVLVTSRDRLSGLVAREGARRLTVRTLEPAEAVELLEHVTERHRPRDDLHEVSELARLCGRLPLALRIAAERAAGRPHMPLGALIQDLRDESALWDALATDDEEEADAVRTVFAWPYRALPEETARQFRLLGLHPGDDFDSAAAAALSGLPVRRARRVLDSLVGAHLVEQADPDRYRFHDLLRSYAWDQARQKESPKGRQEALTRLVTWYLRTADVAARAVDSPLRHLDPCPESDVGAHRHVHEAASLHRRIGDHVREAEAFEGVGEVYQTLGRPDEAAKFYRQAAKEYRGHQEWWRLAVCLDRSASVMVEVGDVEAAGGQWREALESLEDFTDTRAERLREQIIAHLNDAAGPGWSHL